MSKKKIGIGSFTVLIELELRLGVLLALEEDGV